jgi:hypothetical protein
MRVVRTDTFLDKPASPYWTSSPLAKSISTAWFKEEGGADADFDPPTLLMPGYVSRPRSSEIAKFLEDCLWSGTNDTKLERMLLERAGWVLPKDLEDAFNVGVIIEQSPPIALPLSQLLSKSPGIAIGTFVGYQMSAQHPDLMLVYVAGGIVVVSSAIGVARALESGLQDRVKAFFKSKAESKSKA